MPTATQLPPIGRPFTALTPAKVASELAKFETAPFNISARARKLGIARSTLQYHLAGGKSARFIAENSWKCAIWAARAAYRQGKRAEAVALLHEAARRMEAEPL